VGNSDARATLIPSEARTGGSSPSRYREALAWLFQTQRFGIKLGLENSRRLFQELGLPSPNERIIHVAGTNGKGSVCALLDSLCRAAGYRTALFTSPHLITFRERIQVDGAMISEEEVARGLTTIQELVRNWEPHPTFFEIATALALDHFRHAGADIVVLETGMGGRLDATNAVQPVVSVITPIDYDHQQWLGNSLREIAAEKAGIIKAGIPVVSALQTEEVAEVIRARAKECAAAIEFITEPLAERPALAGAHQRQNAALAVAACRAAKISLPAIAIKDGLAAVNWPARFQQWDERIVIDGAHNPAGARVLVETWREVFGEEKATLIFGVLADKAAAEIYRELGQITASIVLPRFRGERVMPPEKLADVIASITPMMESAITDSLAEAIDTARETPHRVVVAGSLHLAGEALAFLRGTPAAFEECAQ
jgi:dihydrofolate synthase/folylpolyglutamate synthase